MDKKIFVVFVSLMAFLLTASLSYSFTITPSAGPGGSISPSTPVTVPLNGKPTFTISPDSGYEVFDVVMDTVSLGPVTSYTFPGVMADHTITASFTECADKVMLEWDSSLFGTITAAYNHSIISGLNDITLKLITGTLAEEDIYFDADISVLLDGGYDCSFQTKSSTTGMPGSLIIAAGTVTVSNFGVEAGPLCAENDPNNFPGNPEICDGLDNNCNGLVDDGLSFDADGDGATSIGSCGGSADDCDDNDPNNFLGNPEICDGQDNNCNVQVDEGLIVVDTDGDGYSAIGSCGSGDDCNDNDPGINPGIAEICDGLDNNCDTQIDEGLSFDADGDGATSIGSCAGSADDCDDNDPNNFPGNPEICDGLDNNCDTQIDENLLPVDVDGDGYTAIGSCGGSADDCNDNDPNIHPYGEIYGDGIDQDCDGQDVIIADQTCFGCHSVNVVNNLVHTNVLPPDGTCADCHAAPVVGLLPGHYGHTVETAGNNMTAGSMIECTSCHDWHDPAEYDVQGAYIVWAKVHAAGGYGNLTCDTCHENRVALHETVYDHTGIVNTTATQCGTCHTSTPLVDPADAKKHKSCSSCHGANLVLVSLAAGKSAPGNCNTCHGSDFTVVHPEPTSDHTALVTVGVTGCADCHNDTPLVSGAADTHNSCTSCHTADGDLISLAIGKTFATGGDCTTCHTGSWESTHTTDPGHTGITVGATGCAACHSDTPFIDPADASNHNGCASCHDAGTGALIGSAVGNPTPTDCTTCHTGSWETTHTTDPGHTGVVTTAGTTGLGGCSQCHNDPPPLVDPADSTVHNACVSCHDGTDGSLIGIAAGVSAPGNCETCHVNQPAHGGCNSCHDSTQPAGAGDYRRQINNNIEDFDNAYAHVIGGVTNDDCVVCHYQSNHTSLSDPQVLLNDIDGGAGSFIAYDGTGGSIEAFCLGCHDADSAGSIPFSDGLSPVDIETTWTGSGHDIASASIGEGCLSCHGGTDSTRTGLDYDQNVHGSGTDSLLAETVNGVLLADNRMETMCFACHDGSLAADIEQTFTNIYTATSPHDTLLNTNHDVTASSQSYSGAVITCSDCHDVHAANLSEKVVFDPDPGDGRLPTAGASWSGSSLMSEWCLDCHDNSFPVSVTPPTNIPVNIYAEWIDTGGTQHGSRSASKNVNLRAGSGYARHDILDCANCHTTGHGATPNLAQLRTIIYSKDGQTVLTPDDTTNGNVVYIRDVESNDGLINGKNWCSTCHPQPMGGNKQAGCLAGNCHAHGNSSF